MAWNILYFRSPGGTPLRPDKPKMSENQDPASLIANALKKKFASRILHSPRSPCSPDTDKENDYASPDSPIAPVSITKDVIDDILHGDSYKYR